MLFHDPRQLRTFELLVPVSDVPQPDPFSALANSVKMKEVLDMIAQEQGFSDKDVQKDLSVLQAKRVRTVGNLRVLSKERIDKELSVGPIVVEYLQRVKAGIGPVESCSNMI